ncbi:Ig-like domain-containing protein [Kitasatospora sp. NPDC059673]|uniref:Ig-like domain-containing protein n=1 Tax=Kitasatospora sp. NPDC059673 TaxID=3346901 RepID=UPI0036860653
MCRQFLHRAPAPDARPADGDRPGPWIGRTTTALIATGLLTGLGTPPVAAQQTPDSWSAERRAQLPSGLAVRFDFEAVQGVTVEAAPGKLAERAAGAGVYTDGIRPGDPAETFRVAEDHPHADGSWHPLGTLRLSFSRPVRNPRLHLSGLTGLATGRGGTTGTSTRLTVAGGSPAAPTLVGRTGWPGWTVGPGELAPAADGPRDGDAGGDGTLELSGTVTTVELRVEQRSTARGGSTTPPMTLRPAWTVSLDESLGSAPQSYGNASHLVSDLFLGQDAAPANRSRPGLAQSVERPLLPAPPAAGPVALSVETDGGASRRSPWASPPSPPRLQPGRADHQGADPTLAFPAEATPGRTYRIEVPVGPGPEPAVLAGWIDFDHNGRFDPAERVQAEVPAGASSAALEWMVPAGAASGDTWARLRVARDGSQLVTADGFADSGQVVDQRVAPAVRAAEPESAADGPEIGLPVPGTVTGEVRPEFRGDGARAGAGIAVQENGATLCTAQVGEDGSWNCRPDSALGESTHALVLAQTLPGGTAVRGEPFRLTVKTTAPTAPVLTLPAYSNDPGLLVTGLGEPASAVTVTADGGPEDLDLCTTGVAADGSWSCLPVENLADGVHRLTPHARDGAGNHSDGKSVALTVDTVAPDKPRLLSPTAGELLHTARPLISGRAEPGATVTVTAGHGNSAPATVCSAVAAADGSWSCTATHDLAGGEVTLIATATDPAGNGTPGDPVRVPVPATAGGSAAPTPSPATAVPSPAVSVPPSAHSPAATSPSAPPFPAGIPTGAAPWVPVLSDLLPIVVPVVIPVLTPTQAPPVPTPAPTPTGGQSSPAASPSVSASATAFASGTAPASAGASAAAMASASASVSAAVPVPSTVAVPPPPFLAPGVMPDQPVFAAPHPGSPQAPEPRVPDGTAAPSGSPSPVIASPAVMPSAGRPSVTRPPSAAAPAVQAAQPKQPKHAARAEQTGAGSADEVARGRTLPAPPPGGAAVVHRAAATGWRGLACGALLITAGFGLLVRRMLASRRGGARRH